MSSNQQFWDDRIAQIDLQIAAYEAAILAFATNGAQQVYRLDTGQQVIRVDRTDAGTLQSILDKLINQRQIYCIRAGRASGTFYDRGSW